MQLLCGLQCGKGKAPLDGRCGLQAGQVTAGMADLLAIKGAELAFQHSGCFLERFFLSSIREHGGQGNREFWAV